MMDCHTMSVVIKLVPKYSVRIRKFLSRIGTVKVVVTHRLFQLHKLADTA